MRASAAACRKNGNGIKEDHGVDIVVGPPRVAYKDTITATVEHDLLWKKQTGGPGQYAKIRLRLSSGQRGSGFTFLDEVKGGAIPRAFIQAVRLGVEDALVRGIAAGCPVVDVCVAAIDGGFHAQDSSEMAFRLAAAACFAEAARLAGPGLLEPIMELAVTVGEDRMGDVVGDVQ